MSEIYFVKKLYVLVAYMIFTAGCFHNNHNHNYFNIIIVWMHIKEHGLYTYIDSIENKVLFCYKYKIIVLIYKKILFIQILLYLLFLQFLMQHKFNE